MSRTKDAIMDIMDWYGYIPEGYTFLDYSKEKKSRENAQQISKEFSETGDQGSNSDQQIEEEKN